MNLQEIENAENALYDLNRAIKKLRMDESELWDTLCFDESNRSKIKRKSQELKKQIKFIQEMQSTTRNNLLILLLQGKKLNISKLIKAL